MITVKQIKNTSSFVLMPIALVFISFLLLVPFESQELIRDSAGWAVYVNSSSQWMFHPHHLLYMPVNWTLLQIISPFCVECDAIDAGQMHSFISAIVMILSVFFLIRHLTGRPVLAFMLAILLLVSQGVWVFALQPQAYAPLIGILSLLFMFLFQTKFQPVTVPWVIFVALIYGLSVLYHQAMVLIALPLAYYIYATKSRNGLKASLSVLFLSGFCVLATYMLAVDYVMGELTIASFHEYVMLFGQVMSDPNYFSLRNLSFSTVPVFLKSQMDVIVGVPWRVRGLALISFVAFIGGMLAWNVWKIIIKAPYFQERVLLISITLIFWILTIWGSPTDYGWPTFILLPIVILMGVSLGDYMPANEVLPKRKKLILVILGVIIIGVALKNLNDRIIPMHQDKGRDYYYAESIAKAIPSECVIYESIQHVYQNLGYYFSRDTADYWDHITAAYYGNKDKHERYFKQPSQAPCIAVDLRYVDPTLRVSGKTGYELPAQWSRLIIWLFDISQENEKIFTWRDFYVVAADNKHTYLVIRNKQTSPRSIGDFWTSLDLAQADVQIGGKNTFEHWRELSCMNSVRSDYINKLCFKY